jgi:hypothetical protein
MEASKVSKGSEFHVLLSGLKLSAEMEKKIESGIQTVVASALAGYPNPDDPDGNDGPIGGGSGPKPGGSLGVHVVIPSLRWKGYWIKTLPRDLVIRPAELEAQQKQLQKGLQVG